MTPANVPFVILGTGMLWFGWFGFNAGSALAAVGPGGDGVRHDEHRVGGSDAGMDVFRLACVATNRRRLARASARWWAGGDHASGRLCQHRRKHRHRHWSRASFRTCAVHWKNKSTLDDTLDVFPCHGVGGMVGMIMTGIFAKDVGLTSGTRVRSWCTAVRCYSSQRSRLSDRGCCIALTEMIIPLRVSEDQEEVGLDISQHEEVMEEGVMPVTAPVLARIA